MCAGEQRKWVRPATLTAHLKKDPFMKSKLAITCLVIGTLLGPVISTAEDADSDRAHPKAFVKDSAITIKVKSKLAAENIKTLAQIQVDTDSNGDVWLSGFARTQEDADTAVRIARETEHVTSVTSEIQIKKDD
jgi:hyperosmotically inducible protein